MRFSLQHILVWQGGCLAVIAGNVALGGTCNLGQGLCSLIVCGAGSAVAIAWYAHRHKEVLLAPLKAQVAGMGVALAVSLGLGMVFGNWSEEVCALTRCVRTSRQYGVLNATTVSYGPEAKIIRDEFGYAPRGHKWVPMARGLGLSNDTLPEAVEKLGDYPALFLRASELHRIARSFEHPETMAGMFALENPWDESRTMLTYRRWVFQELRNMPVAKDDGEQVRRWWFENEPLMRSIKSESELKTALKEFCDRSKNADMLSDVRRYLEYFDVKF